MGCIRVDKITEYLCEPLRKCLKDEDPYVRKTAAVCVAKLHDINAQLVEDQGFLDSLRDLLSDSNPMVGLSRCISFLTVAFYFLLKKIIQFAAVISSDGTLKAKDIETTFFKFFFYFQVVANAVAALSEISDASPTAAAMMEINSQTINKLLTALNECTEWVSFL